MQDKTTLITGANTGIGFATAAALAAKGATVILHARNEEKARDAKQRLQEKYPAATIDTAFADLASRAQILKMAELINNKYPKLDVLVNNAGIITKSFQKTEDGFEMQFGVNHMAPFLLTNLLLPRLKAAKSARIVNVSSDAHYRCKEIDFDKLNDPKGYKGFDAYCRSKLCNVLFTKSLAKRVANDGIVVNALHPGVISTNIGEKHMGWMGLFWKIMRPFMRTAEKGAETSVFLAATEEAGKINGGYFENRKEKKPSRAARDEALAEALWAYSLNNLGNDIE